MKKFTLILFFTFLGVLFIPAQKNSNVFEKNNTEATFQQKESNTDNNSAPKFMLNGKILSIANIENGTIIEIYSALGARVQSVAHNGNPISLTNLNKGIYIVRAGKYTQKIML